MAQRGKKAIIFVATCDEVEYFAALCHNVCVEDKPIFGEFAVLKLHGNIEQK
jgi:superfamily II DNA/RNA helicase